jgi:peptidoglycan/xylan/chitin deacetylase (PgdA/CDA1 family)
MRKRYKIFILLFLFVTALQELLAQEVQFEIAKYKDNKTCALSYTFDDALSEHYTLVTPALNKHGFKGTFWVNGVKINSIQKPNKDTTRVNWDQLREMVRQGHEISNHGYTHKNLVRSTFEEVEYEIFKNDTVIFEQLGIWPKTFCYPNNAKTKEIIELASRNRIETRLFQFSMGSKSTHKNLEEKVNSLLNNQEWGVAMIHGITYGYDRFIDANILWRHLEKVNARKAMIWVATFEDVAAYVKQRDNIAIEVIKTKKGYQVVPKMTLNPDLFNKELTLIIKTSSNKNKIISVMQNGKKLLISKNSESTFINFNPWGGSLTIN